MDFEHLIVEREAPLAVVSINRHERRNALAAQTLDELEAAFRALEGEADIRAVIITGAGGKAFCAGADLEEGFDATADTIYDIVRRGQAVFQYIEQFPKPVVAAVTGYAFGGGLELMLCCDVVVAEENANLGQPEVTRGLIPGWGGTQKIPRIAGKNAALELLLLGNRIRAPRAAEMGLVNQVVPKGEGLSAAKELAARLAKNPALPMALIKDAVLRGAQLTLEQGLDIEARNFARSFRNSDWNKG